MNKINEFFVLLDSYIGGSEWFIVLLLGTGLFFTIYLRFPQFRFFKHALNVVRGKYDKPEDKGDTSHFQSLTTALSGTVGTGNIAGVAFAIFLGGPASLFWMIVCAFFGMTTKFVEVTLSHKYREIDEKGFISGGPMYYMKNKMKAPWLAGFFAVMVIVSSFGTGSFPQINSITNSMFSTFGFNKILTGGVLTVVLAFVILGGIKRIASVTEKLVPIMAIIYLIGAFAVIIHNYENILPALGHIIGDVFTGTAAVGGFLGASFSFAFNRGVNRGLFSNEAGLGSAPIAHAAARTSESVSEGVVAILEPFVDTILICTITGLVILSSGAWTNKYENRFQTADMLILADSYDSSVKADNDRLSSYICGEKDLNMYTGELEVKEGVIQNDLSIMNSRSLAEDVKVLSVDEILFTGSVSVENGQLASDEDVIFEGKSLIHSAPLTAEAFTSSIFGEWGRWIVTLGLLMFAFSTAIAWAYYGGRSVTYLFGNKGVLPFRIIYCIAFFVASFIDTTIVWTLSGITIALMAMPNLIGILWLRKDMRSEISGYLKRLKRDFPND